MSTQIQLDCLNMGIGVYIVTDQQKVNKQIK